MKYNKYYEKKKNINLNSQISRIINVGAYYLENTITIVCIGPIIQWPNPRMAKIKVIMERKSEEEIKIVYDSSKYV